LRGAIPVITQTAEWDEDEHVPIFSTQAISYGFAALDCQAAVFSRFSREILGNSNAEASTDDSDSDIPAQGEHTMIVTGDMSIEDSPAPEPEPTIAFKPSSGNWTWSQALEADRREKAEQRAFETPFG
jgi:hypothetical protein